jgi:carbonic anhydrase
VGHTSCGGVLASLNCAKDVSVPLPSPELNRFLTPLVDICGSVRKEMGIKDGEEPSEEEAAILLRKATEANVKAQVEKVAASKIIQSNWAGKNSSFPGEPKHKVKIYG